MGETASVRYRRGSIRDFVEEQIAKAKEIAAKLIEQAKAKLDAAKEKLIPAIRAFIDQLKEAAKAEIEHLKPIVEATIERVKEIAQKLDGDAQDFIKDYTQVIKETIDEYREKAKQLAI